VLYEPVDTNPYLEDFYNDMARWAFHSQVHFFAKRLEQYSAALRSNEPFIQDRSLSEDVNVFARNLYLQGAMSEREWRTYRDLCGTLLLGLQPPNAYVYLRASVPTLLERIAHLQRQSKRETTIGGT
jgi:deoxyadenosine/deoxycytidine kinase